MKKENVKQSYSLLKVTNNHRKEKGNNEHASGIFSSSLWSKLNKYLLCIFLFDLYYFSNPHMIPLSIYPSLAANWLRESDSGKWEFFYFLLSQRNSLMIALHNTVVKDACHCIGYDLLFDCLKKEIDWQFNGLCGSP